MKPDELSFISGLGSERGMSASPLFEICSAQNALVGKVGSQKFFTKEIIDLCLVKSPGLSLSRSLMGMAEDLDERRKELQPESSSMLPVLACVFSENILRFLSLLRPEVRENENALRQSSLPWAGEIIKYLADLKAMDNRARVMRCLSFSSAANLRHSGHSTIALPPSQRQPTAPLLLPLLNFEEGFKDWGKKHFTRPISSWEMPDAPQGSSLFSYTATFARNKKDNSIMQVPGRVEVAEALLECGGNREEAVQMVNAMSCHIEEAAHLPLNVPFWMPHDLGKMGRFPTFADQMSRGQAPVLSSAQEAALIFVVDVLKPLILGPGNPRHVLDAYENGRGSSLMEEDADGRLVLGQWVKNHLMEYASVDAEAGPAM